MSGSLCGGVEATYYRDLIEALHEKNVKVFLDADSDAFKHGIEAKPYFIKPNREELLSYFGRKSATREELIELCRELINAGIAFVALSMGKDGALFVTARETLYSPALDVIASSTVGAGDSMVGAIAYALDSGMSVREAARLSIAASAGAVTTIGTNPPSRELVYELEKRVQLETV